MEKNINLLVNIFFHNDNNPLILFYSVSPVSKFPVIPRHLNIAFGLWEILLQTSLAQTINSMDNVYLLGERLPDGKEKFLEDGIHPSARAYYLWSEKLAIMTVNYLNQEKLSVYK